MDVQWTQFSEKNNSVLRWDGKAQSTASFLLRGFRWGLSDSKYPQVSRTLLSILTDLNYTVVWRISICPLISESSRPLIDYDWYHRNFVTKFFLFSSLARSRYLYLFRFLFILFWGLSGRQSPLFSRLFFLFSFSLFFLD